MKRNNYSPSILVVILLISFQGISQDFQGIIDNYLTQNASRHNLEPADVQNFGITSHTKVTNKDYDVAYLQQTYNGIKVAGTAATVVINDKEVVSFKHSFTNDLASKVNASTATLSPADAVRKAAMHLGLQGVDNVKVTDYNTRDDVLLANVNNSNFFSPLYYQKNQNNQYELTYEVIVKDPGLHWWLARVNASNGDLIFKADLNLTCNFDNRVTDAKPHDHRSHSHTFSTNKESVLLKAKNDATNESRAFSILFDNSSYNAYPLRVESPIHGERTIINEPAIISTQPGDVEIPSPFGWHDLDGLAGAETNFTQGNNVSAYEDTTDNDAPTSPNAFATESSSPLIFDYPVDFSQEPITYQDAVIVNLFVWNNYIHDIFYNYGFDESSGNFQETDYGRFDGDGIIPFNGDSVNAEAQDGSGLNNANMATSLDGANPRMQMFLWGAAPFGEFLEVLPPSGFEGTYASTRFPFVPIPRETDPIVQANIIVVEDDGGIYLGDDGGTPGPSPDTDDGCTAAVNAADLNGNIAIIRRGVCTFATKIRLAQEAGAIAAIIVNNVPGDGPVVGGGEPSTPITIPSISISFEDGDALIQAINGGETIEGRVVDRGPIEDTIQKDGDFDQGIIAHEYAHGISTRLTGGRERFDCLLSQAFEEQMGEGWSDWAGLITTQKLDDTAEQPRGIGTYVLGQDVLGSGIRPARYSTDFAVNDYTYGDLPNEEITVPHGVGFIWATIIWDLHWALINEHGFDPDLYYGTGGNNIATQLVMDGLKLQTCGNVGFVDGRNAILQADQLLYGGANECIIRGVFARRGVGALALQGTSQSRLDQVEDFTINVPGGTDCEAVLSTVDFDEVVFSIYPNPADDVINIYSNKAAGDALVQIYDMNGREVFASKIDLASFPKINTSTYNTGVYIVKVSSDEITHSQKLIIR